MLVSSPSQAEYIARIRGVDRERCLVVPVDVGKRSAMALVADHCHEVVVDPFTFELNDDGVRELLARTNEFAATVEAGSVRFGVEAAGHYHRGLVTALHDRECDVVEVNPAVVKDARGRIGQRRVKTDAADCLALAEVLIDGLGHTPKMDRVEVRKETHWRAHHIRTPTHPSRSRTRRSQHRPRRHHPHSRHIRPMGAKPTPTSTEQSSRVTPLLLDNPANANANLNRNRSLAFYTQLSASRYRAVSVRPEWRPIG